MRQITVTRIRRTPLTINAVPVRRRKRRGFHPSTHDFFMKLGGAVAAILILVPLLYVVAKGYVE